MDFFSFIGRETVFSIRRINKAARKTGKALSGRIQGMHRRGAMESSDNIPSPVRFEGLESRRLLSAGIYDHNGFYVVPGGPTINVFTGGGLVTFSGSTTHKNTMTVTLSSDGKTLIGTLNGITSDFPVDMVSEIKMFGGNYGDSFYEAPNVDVNTAVQAGTGNDTIVVGGGTDTMHGNTGADSIVCGSGNDIAWGENGGDTLICGSGNDSVFGNAGADSIKGGPGYDELVGGGGGDTVVPGSANNYGDFVEAVATPPVTSGLQPEITATGPTTIQADHMVAVQAMYSGLPAGVTPLTALYQWNFGDTTSGSQFDTLEGFNAAHQYNTPGDYTITLKITDPSGATATTTIPVVVQTPTVRTIYVSTSGSDSNSGLSPSSPIQSVAKANSLLSSNTDLLFEAGDTFDMSATLDVNGYTNVVISSYGSGSQAVLMWTGARTGQQMIVTQGGSRDVTISNLAFNSIYDQDTNETGMPFAIVPEGFDISIIGNTFLNVGYAVQGAGAPNGLLVESNAVPLDTGLRGYFVWVAGTDISILGNSVVNSTREHIIREVGANRVEIAYNTLQNLSRTSVDPSDIAKATISLETGEYTYVYENTLLDGGAGAQPPQTPNDANAGASRMEYVVFDSNTSYWIEYQIGPGSEHLMFRNNISYTNGGQAYLINSSNSEYGTNVSDLTIANNTSIDDGVSGNFLKTSNAGATGIAVDNNLFIAPKLLIGINGASNVYLTAASTAGFTFSHNVWAMGVPTRENPAAQMFISPYLLLSGLLSPGQWNAESGVTDDSFVNVSLNSSEEPATNSIAYTGGISVAGIYMDANGVLRTSSHFGVGALLPEG